MAENSVAQLLVKYQHLNKTLEFSDLSQIFVPEKAFETFVDEISAAFEIMRELRELSKDIISKDEKRKIDDLSHKILQVMLQSYYPNRAYALECASAREDALRNPDTNLAEDVKVKILFEECLGPVVRELGVPISSFSGYAEIIQEYSLPDNRKQGMLAINDKYIEWVLKVMSLCRRHLRGEINLWEYTHEEIQVFLN